MLSRSGLPVLFSVMSNLDCFIMFGRAPPVRPPFSNSMTFSVTSPYMLRASESSSRAVWVASGEVMAPTTKSRWPSTDASV